jgi:hypothetical protein
MREVDNVSAVWIRGAEGLDGQAVPRDRARAACWCREQRTGLRRIAAKFQRQVRDEEHGAIAARCSSLAGGSRILPVKASLGLRWRNLSASQGHGEDALMFERGLDARSFLVRFTGTAGSPTRGSGLGDGFHCRAACVSFTAHPPVFVNTVGLVLLLQAAFSCRALK